MELKPGYKMTEVGVIPEDWEVRNMSEITDPQRPISYGIVQTGPNVQNGIPCLRVLDINDGQINKSELITTTKQISDAYRRTVLKEGDLVMPLRGKVGDVGIIDSELEGANLTRGVALIAILPSWNGQFCRQLISWPVTRKRLEHTMNGSALQEIPIATLRLFKIGLPPSLPEQRAIAEALSDADNLIEALDRLIAKKRDLKQAAMQELLTGKTRLPGFGGEWEVKTLFDLAERKKELFDDGDWIESEHITSEGIRLIQTGNIGIGGFIEKETKKFIYEKSFTLLQCKPLRTGDLLVCRLADPAGRACVLPDIGEERIVTSVDVTIFRPSLEIADRVFLANVFSTPEWFRTVSDRCGGTTHKRISRGALGRLTINLPPLPEQTAIAEILSDLDGEIAALEARRDKTRALKQGMMAELLTGKTRLL